MNKDAIIFGLVFYLLFLISLSLHEWAHGFIAYKLGDETPRIFGRLTINPLAHIDLVGTVIVPLAMILLTPGFILFGWAKPVPIDPNNFKNTTRGEVLTSLAGPAMNLLLACLSVLLGAFCIKILNLRVGPLFGLMALMNIMLFVFNIIPIPPLDGSHVLKLLKVPSRVFYSLARYGFFIVLVLINIPVFYNLILMSTLYLFSTLVGAVSSIFSIVPDLLFPL